MVGINIRGVSSFFFFLQAGDKDHFALEAKG